MPSVRPWRSNTKSGLTPSAWFVPAASSRTTSGKSERVTCRQRFTSGQFEFIELWKSPLGNGSAGPVADDKSESPQVAAGDSRSLDGLALRLARPAAGACAGAIDTGQPLAVYGLDSLMAVELMHDVEQVFGRQLDVGVLVDAPSIAVLAQRLAGEMPPPVDTAEAAPPGVVRPTYRGPFGDRPDGILVRGESAMREMMPYLMRRRNESVVYHEANYDISRDVEWLEAYNRQHAELRVTLLDLFLWAAAYVGHARPGMNRFISGRRIYQRREVAISFAAKKRYDLSAELVTVKMTFPEKAAPFSDCVRRIAAAVERACHGPPRAVDRETELSMRLPRWLLRTVLWGYRILDHCNLLPGKLIANDPLYATMFVANLGSLGLDSATHHLYEHGTCSLFAALGLPKKMAVATADGRLETLHAWPVRWTLDERIVDGFYPPVASGC